MLFIDYSLQVILSLERLSILPASLRLYWLVYWFLQKCQENCFVINFVAKEGQAPAGQEDGTENKQNAKFIFQGDLHMVRIYMCFGLTTRAGTSIFYSSLLLLQDAPGRAVRATHGWLLPALHCCKVRLRTWSCGELSERACRESCLSRYLLPFQVPSFSLSLLDLLDAEREEDIVDPGLYFITRCSER